MTKSDHNDRQAKSASSPSTTVRARVEQDPVGTAHYIIRLQADARRMRLALERILTFAQTSDPPKVVLAEICCDALGDETTS